MTTARSLSALSLSITLAAAGCAPPPPVTDAGDAATVEASAPDAAVTDAAPAGDPVTIRFAGVVGARPFACGQTYPMMGANNSTWTPKDFRFYVHDVRLVTADGEVPVAIDTVGAFQGAGVALIDLEDRSGSCSDGTAETNAQIVGRARVASAIRGLKFKVGVPFMLNHREPSSAPAPLNLSSMWWTWNAGYKFLKIDGSTVGLPMGYNIHVGSTGCTGNNMGPASPCSAPNVMEVTLDNFDPARDNVVADLSALVSGANLEQNAAMSAPGCMSTPTDTDCAPIFSSLGLPFAMAPAGTQSFFRVVAR